MDNKFFKLNVALFTEELEFPNCLKAFTIAETDFFTTFPAFVDRLVNLLNAVCTPLVDEPTLFPALANLDNASTMRSVLLLIRGAFFITLKKFKVSYARTPNPKEVFVALSPAFASRAIDETNSFVDFDMTYHESFC